MTDEAMVEAVARALCSADGVPPDAPVVGSDQGLWWMMYRHSARAAIPLIIERCAEVAEAKFSGMRYGPADEAAFDVAFDIAEDIRALFRKETDPS